MHKFPSINQFANVIGNVKHRARYVGVTEDGSVIYDESRPFPTLKYRGTVKLHGTNSSVVFDNSKRWLTFQSREREITVGNDNENFARTMSEPVVFDALLMLGDILAKNYELDNDRRPLKVAIFGE